MAKRAVCRECSRICARSVTVELSALLKCLIIYFKYNVLFMFSVFVRYCVMNVFMFYIYINILIFKFDC